MVPILILIPAAVALAMLYTGPASRVLLRVYLPCLMLIPMYFEFPIKGIGLNASGLVVTLLAIAGVAAQRRTLRVTPLDVCVVLLACSAFYSDAQHGSFTLATYSLVTVLFSNVFPYIVGRTLIEQNGMRVHFAKTMILFLCCIALFSVWEFRMISNPFQNIVESLTGVRSGWIRQMRYGFGRVCGPFGHAISAGEIFTTGLMLQLWLTLSRHWRRLAPGSASSTEPMLPGNSRVLPWMTTGGIVAGLVMTLSRGPWIGCGFGLIVASIGLFKNRRLASAIAITVLVGAFVATSVTVDQYTAAGATSRPTHQVRPLDGDQQNAVYRRQLIETYMPLVQQGGWFGWGGPFSTGFTVSTYTKQSPSIDNQYLLVAMSQGYVGFTLFVLIILLSIFTLIAQGGKLRSREDNTFCFCLLGIVVAMAFTLTTVYLGQPMIQIFFLILGWAGSLRPSGKQAAEAVAASATAQPYRFERVFV